MNRLPVGEDAIKQSCSLLVCASTDARSDSGGIISVEIRPKMNLATFTNELLKRLVTIQQKDFSLTSASYSKRDVSDLICNETTNSQYAGVA